jgi:hypothetical protein
LAAGLPVRCHRALQFASPRLRLLGRDGGEGWTALDGRDLDLGGRPLTGVTSTSCERRVLQITESGAPGSLFM